MAGFLSVLMNYSNQPSDALTLKGYICDVLDMSIECLRKSNTFTTPTTAGACPRIWAFATCWPPTPFNTTFTLPCSPTTSTSSSDPSVNSDVSLFCNETLQDWNNHSSYHNCFESVASESSNQSDYDYGEFSSKTIVNQTQFLIDANSSDSNLANFEPSDLELDDPSFRYHVLSTSVTIGHALSLISLVIALLLLIFLRRIHCTRIYIHINLMAAFFLRGLLWILHMAALHDLESVEDQDGKSVLDLALKIFKRHGASDLSMLEEWKKDHCVSQVNTNHYAWCRVYYVMLNYTVTANYYWLLVEGLYLSFLLRAVVFSQKKYMRAFMGLGWGLPWLSVIGTILAKVLDKEENNRCWWLDENSAYWWIIKVPILLSLLINFAIFVMIILVVGSKLRVNNLHRANENKEDYKWRLAKSTLALIPLLGIQYVVTAFVGFNEKENSTAAFVRKAFELSFTSIQGMLVSFIYCFFNGEVQDECKKTWKRFKLRWEMRDRDKYFKRRKRASTATSITNLHSFFWRRKSSAASTALGKPSDVNLRSITAPSKEHPKLAYNSTLFTDVIEITSTSDVRSSQTRLNGFRVSQNSLNNNRRSDASSDRSSKTDYLLQASQRKLGNGNISPSRAEGSAEEIRLLTNNETSDGLNVADTTIDVIKMQKKNGESNSNWPIIQPR